MTKVAKKKNRKLRRQIRKTIGALLMVSAIVVAAIPVTGVNADESGNGIAAQAVSYPDETRIKVVNYTDANMSSYDQVNGADAPVSWQSKVPFVDQSASIYTTGTSGNVNFQFAFVRPAGEADQVAVILGATINNLPNNSLIIPETVDAYKKYTANTTSTGYCAVNRSDEFLYYKTRTQKENDYGEPLFKSSKNPGNPTIGTPIVEISPTFTAAYSKADVDGIVKTWTESMEKQDDTYWFVVTKTWKENVDGEEVEQTDTQKYETFPIMIDSMSTCDYDNQDPWIGLKDSELYYWNDSTTSIVDLNDVDKFALALAPEKQRIHDAKVLYIGRQYLVGKDGEWTIDDTVDPKDDASKAKGVFAGKTQIVNLTIGDNLVGIGDAAFYGCGGIESVTLGNGLNTIGNSAFENCINMKNCNMELFSKISVMGRKAFQNCRALKNITIPIGVEAIGDYCFSGCSALETIELCGNGNNVQLNGLGYMIFQNCSSLSSITFPTSFYQDSQGLPADEKNGIPIRYFNGCSSLQFIKVQNTDLDIIDGMSHSTYEASKTVKEHDKSTHPNDEINQFLDVVSDSFYFEGPSKIAAYSDTDSPIHLTAKIHSASFKYLDEDKYERVVTCPETPSHSNTFIINSYGQLLEMDIDDQCKEVEIPSKIGTYGILELSSDSFKHKCFLEKVTIPSSVESIQSGAFEGCHRLKHVIFEQPENSKLVIQDQAFNTQVVDPLFHIKGCDDKVVHPDPNETNPSLTFTGTISESSSTFLYAMNPNNNINRGTQPTTYITFYSGWPTNLTAQYNQDTKKNELIDYPKYDELTSYTKDSFPYMTTEMVSAASQAVTDYENWKTSGYSDALRPTEDEMAIVNSALNPVLPAGITAIKSGIFSDFDSEGKVVTGGATAKPNTKVESVTCNTVETIEPYTFAGCTGLTGFWMNGGNKIDDYAFKNCGENLVNVGIGSSVSELGKRPFAGCTGVSNVVFTDNPNFTCEEAIIYGTTDGVKDTIVECLEGRGLLQEVSNTQVGPDELAGITTIMPEAFKNCDEIVTVDLSSSSVTSVPEQCFAQTDRLSTVILPNGTVKSIDKGAFWNSLVANVRIPDKATLIELQAFANVSEDAGEILLDVDGNPTIKDVTSGHRNITFNCPDDSFANTYADKYYYINTKSYEYFKVIFKDGIDFSTLSEQTVMYGEAAKEPTPKNHDGMTFTGWDSDGYKFVIKDGTYYAQYIGAAYSVTYVDGVTSKVLSKETVEAGKNGNPPTPIEHKGYTFVEWRPSATGVTGDMICVAYYKDNSGESSRHKCTFYGRDGSVVAAYTVNDKESVTPPAAPAISGYTFVSWIPADFTNITEDKVYYASYDKTSAGASPSGGSSSGASASPSSTAGNNNNGNNGDNTKKYTVSVSGGSGSGSYPAGAIVALNAYDMGVGKQFDKWTTSTAGVGFANAEATSTTFTMPAANVAITATYKTGNGASPNTGGNNGGSGTSGNGSNGNSGSNGSSGSNSNRNSGTTVQVTKPGISNTNLAGATVAGSTDNFVVKVTEDQTANDLAVQALQAKFGDISRVKYLPMDISLYDSTGRTKIADTSGISVNITLPLPDDLAQYAGNNKVASTLGGTIEDLNTRFTTVDGVPCVNFTATHFSPYVIYVNTANLTEGTIDATPKTGDPIHPKWFLALGLASLSLILFFKRDRKLPKTRTA